MEKKVVIVGAGISGLSAGCYARMNGYDAEIHEAHTLPGGLCTTWKRNGYVVDGCIHWLTGTQPGSSLYRIWCGPTRRAASPALLAWAGRSCSPCATRIASVS